MTPYRHLINTAVPLERVPGDYLTLDELEAIAWEFRHLGVSILAAQGVGPEWHLVVPIKGVQTKFRAHRVEGGEVA